MHATYLLNTVICTTARQGRCMQRPYIFIFFPTSGWFIGRGNYLWGLNCKNNLLLMKNISILTALILLLTSSSGTTRISEWRGPDRRGFTTNQIFLKSWPAEGPGRTLVNQKHWKRICFTGIYRRKFLYNRRD